MVDISWTLKQVTVASLTDYSKNPRSLTKDQFKHLKTSLDKFGLIDKPIVNLDNVVIGGHQRLNVLRSDHAQEVECWYPSRQLTDKEVEELNIRLNKNMGSWDFDILANGFELDNLLEWGFDKQELDLDLWAGEMADEPEEIEPSNKLVEKWNIETGQWWEIGDTAQIYCGSASEAHIKCDLAIYDPPFDWSASQYHQIMDWCSWKKAVVLGLRHVMALAERHDFLHWWIWDSGVGRFGGKGYKPMSGCALFLVFGDKRAWNEQEALSILEAAGIEHYNWPVQVVKIQTLLKESREFSSYQKPASLIRYTIALYSEAGDIIGDPFAGSGELLFGSLNLGRRYVGSEIDPLQIAVILERASLINLNISLKKI
jgi:hypothetical protein